MSYHTRKHTLLLVCVVLFMGAFILPCSASDESTVTGQIIDPTTKKPVSDLVILFRSDSVQTVLITNDTGYYYAYNLPAGKYRIEYSLEDVFVILISDFILEPRKEYSLNFQINTPFVKAEGCFFPRPCIQIKSINNNTCEITRCGWDGGCGYPIDYVTEISVTEIVTTKPEEGKEPALLYMDGIRYKNIPLLSGSENCEYYSGFIPPKYNDLSTTSEASNSKLFSPIGVKP